MSNFKIQIDEDIQEYKQQFAHIVNISKSEWAFNYWILDKFFHEDEELIESKILDYHDLGIDAYVIYEDTKDIYLIQNKYYSDSSKITGTYVKNDFLLRAINALENGTYKKSKELQTFFTKFKNHPDFTVHLELFVTNNEHSQKSDEYINTYNINHPKHIAKIFYLDDIAERYYGEVKENRKNITVKIESVNRGTILNINNDSYKLENVVDARYVFAPVTSIYRIYRDAIEKGYPIFDKNIREYLGNKGINKRIYQTLLDSDERKNFFYYNNGVTIICDKMRSITTNKSDYNMNAIFEIDNPQIVNGCQTVNSIYEALRIIDPNVLEKEYKDTFVMLKILEINKNDITENDLCQKIVKYNNSQNSIDEKTFETNTNIFLRLQDEFERRGFILLIKQSDKNKFGDKYKLTSGLNKLNAERLKRFGLHNASKPKDVYIPIEKLLQVVTAFTLGAHSSYTKKSNMLKYNSTEYNNAVAFIKNGTVTNDVLLDLYLLYMRAEQSKKESVDKRTPIPFYLIDAFAKYECQNREEKNIQSNLDSNEKIEFLIKLYTSVTKFYTKDYNKKYSIEYNMMIKRKVDYEILENGIDILS